MKIKPLKIINSWILALQHLGQQRLILILSVVVGILSGLSAVILKNTIHFIRDIIERIMEQGTLGFL